jgi:hypothetical protein
MSKKPLFPIRAYWVWHLPNSLINTVSTGPRRSIIYFHSFVS